ncbi:MAG: hypothetical protein AB1798_22630, partial [Spirochaetota bacterium]
MSIRAKYSPAQFLSTVFHTLVRTQKKYGAEWWILIAGAIVILFVIYMALFPGTIALYDPLDQNTGPQMVGPGSGHPMGTD